MSSFHSYPLNVSVSCLTHGYRYLTPVERTSPSRGGFLLGRPFHALWASSWGDGWAVYWAISLSIVNGRQIGIWLAKRWNLRSFNGDLPITQKCWIDIANDSCNHAAREIVLLKSPTCLQSQRELSAPMIVAIYSEMVLRISSTFAKASSSLVSFQSCSEIFSPSAV